MKLAKMSLAVVLAISLAGCNYLTVAQRANNVIGAILVVAQAETPMIPPADQVIYIGFVTLAESLNAQLSTCITAAGKAMMPKASTFGACFNAFSAGLSTPTELAQLKVLSIHSQGRVQLYLVSVIAGVNVALGYFGGTAAAVPVVASPPTAAELAHLRTQIGY